MASLKELVNEGMEALFQAGLLDEDSAATVRGTPGGAKKGFGLQTAAPAKKLPVQQKKTGFLAKFKAWRMKGKAPATAPAGGPAKPKAQPMMVRKLQGAGNRPSRQVY